jgi:hypothetical protein
MVGLASLELPTREFPQLSMSLMGWPSTDEIAIALTYNGRENMHDGQLSNQSFTS